MWLRVWGSLPLTVTGDQSAVAPRAVAGPGDPNEGTGLALPGQDTGPHSPAVRSPEPLLLPLDTQSPRAVTEPLGEDPPRALPTRSAPCPGSGSAQRSWRPHVWGSDIPRR